MTTYQQIMEWLEPDLQAIRACMLDMCSCLEGKGLLGRLVLESAETPGKMLRPALMMIAAGDYPPEARDELIASAAAIELSHTSSLVLDDMVDGAATRRGKPTVQAAYGSDVALYTGLTLLMRAQEALLANGYLPAAKAMARTVQVMCAGEMDQHDNLHDVDSSVERYLQAISGKTASLFEVACTLACEVTGKDEAYTKALGRIGWQLGMMFQIRDDLNDWTLTEEVSGKPVNEDFQNGTYTLPALYAFEDKVAGPRLRGLAAKPQLSAGDLAELRALAQGCGAIERTRADLAERRDEALGLVADALSGRAAETLSLIIRVVAE